MRVVKNRKDLISGLLLLVLPTIFISFPLIEYVSEHYSLLFINSTFLLSLFSVGLISAYVLHSTNLRFLLVFGVLLLLLYYGYQSISAFPFTEFDAYYIANRFKINASIFAVGWFVGFGISRWRYFLVFFSVALIGLSVITISAVGEPKVDVLVWLLAPPVFYVFYILFIKELLYNIRRQAKVQYSHLILRVLGFGTLIFLLFWLTTQLLQSKFDEIEEQIASSSSQNEEGQNPPPEDDDSMMDKNSKNQFRLKEYTQLRPRLKQSEELLFCAYIDNFFAEGVPNPQYITLYHLNQYNVDLERFEIDPDNLVKDLFLPDPTQIPNYFVQMDSSVLEHDKMEKQVRQVQSTMYINQLDPDVFVAPSTAFSCQPISVEDEFRDQYKFAYNINSEVSALNSAYFVYNARDPQITEFQEQRYDILRKAKDYSQEDSAFIEYYTRMPERETFDAIRNLADSLTKGADKPIDKVIKIRDYFLSKDEDGEAVFTYTLTPGSPTDPNIPDASLLHNFLFNTQKGYCTYFATSTLFMLRSLKIPVRMAVGFMTVNRSHNNPGWYWYYADQAHAWTQVYFPEYGWLDFDMTISNEDASDAPQPDATPPTPPTNAHFVGRGIIQSIDTTANILEVEVIEAIIKQEGMELETPRTFELNADKAKVYAGKEAITFKELQLGDSAVVVSFDETINKMRSKRSWESVDKFLDRLPENINVQEVHIPEREEEELFADEEETTTIADSVDQWVNFSLVIFAVAFVLLLAAPSLHNAILLNLAKNRENVSDQAVSIYRHLHFVLNQLGIGRGNTTPMVYAAEKIDPKFGTNMESFVDTYLKIKYSNEALSKEEAESIRHFYPEFYDKVMSNYNLKEKVLSFLKVNRWFYFLLNLNLKK